MRCALGVFLFAITALGQQTVSSVRIQAQPVGAPFFVDGVWYTTPQTFLWVQGSPHYLSAQSPPVTPSQPTEYYFQTWSDGAGARLNTGAKALFVYASPSVTEYLATYIVNHRLDIAPAETGSGLIEVNSTAVTSPTRLYFPEGSEILLRASPSPGWVFNGWNYHNLQQNSYLTKFLMTAPAELRPVFARGRHVRLTTSPPGLNIYVDRTLTTTPTETDWAYLGTYHLAAPSPQRDDRNRTWMFDSWDIGGGQNLQYKVTNAGDFSILGRFVRGVPAIFDAVPAGLRLDIDGRQNWASYQFWWPSGSTKTIKAPVEQTDLNGRKWTFREWAHGGDATQSVTLTDAMADDGIRWLARYDAMPRLTLDSTPSGIEIQVDGAACRTPCRIDRGKGNEIKIQPTTSIALSEDSRLDFAGWSDGGAAARVVAINGDTALRATYRRMHRLAATSSPEGTARFHTEPASDGFFAEGSSATIEVEPSPGYKLKRWEGDAYGTWAATTVAMTGPRAVRAVMEPSPWTDPAGVRNGAAKTPDAVVAPGSRVIVTGLNLAGDTVVAKTNPLPQTLDDLIVVWQDRLLPLIAVSPEMIQTALPWDMPEGEAKLLVRRVGQPDVKATAQIVRNAPGLFERFTREPDGSVTLLATGVGPYDRIVPEGFALPNDFQARVVDPVEVLAGEQILTPFSAMAATGQVGIAAIRVHLPPGVAEVKLRVGGRVSNTISVAPATKPD